MEAKLKEESDLSFKKFMDETKELFKKQSLELASITEEYEDKHGYGDLDEDQRIDPELETEDHEYLICGDAAELVNIRLRLIDDDKRDSTEELLPVRKFVAECTCNGVVVATALVGGQVTRGAREDTISEAVDLDFWRSCGFRRIGASKCFAFSFNLDHPSHALAAASDFNPRRSYARDLENQKLRVIYEADRSTCTNALRMERLRNALPLHYASLTLTDKPLKASFITHANDEISWDRVTNSEATLLHLTACEFKPLSVQWLLENIHHAEYWKIARNIDGFTPFEALQEKLEKMRTQDNDGLGRIITVSDQFEGHPDTTVSCLCLLPGHNSLANKACFRYGCTCGECVEGFLSVKMTRYLMRQCDPKVRSWVIEDAFSNPLTLDQFDPDVHQNLAAKKLRLGYSNMFKLALYCLTAGKAPTVQNLEWCRNKPLNQKHSEWAPNEYIQDYLRYAGVQEGYEAVLRLMFVGASQNAENILGTLKDLDLADEPTCRNDYEYEFVTRACGY
ncbi:hypothetical protein N7493_011234 [Penicillium malachiteum]|uniref:Uncharacterized protein n=1 Tax=Penicillium malachiteum TaxID=1324776 RepID=A0AAD6HBR6_9EURO|nr:hypothetical protein N7493_011234 [Penicillium malachiteum]